MTSHDAGGSDDTNDTAAPSPSPSSSPRATQGVSSLRAAHDAASRLVDDWTQRCATEEVDALRMEQQLRAALASTAHLGAPNAFRTAICFDVATQIGAKFPRFGVVTRLLQSELARAAYVTLPSPPAASSSEAARVHGFFSQQTFFSQLQRVLEKKRALQAQLDGLDAMHTLMLSQLRHEERMVDTVARRWASVVLRQTLVDWKKIIVRKKYTRVLLERTSARWGKQRLLRQFRQWVQFAADSRVARARESLQLCADQTRDLEDLLAKMESQIDSATAETRSHREHYDFAKRQILSLEELVAQLEASVHASHERRLQTIANEWGRVCLAFVDCQLDFLQNMVDALPLAQYADASLLLLKGEELSELLRLPSDALVLRWINWHLSRSSATFLHFQPTPIGFIQNFGSDMKNHYVLRHVLQRVLDQAEQLAERAASTPEKRVDAEASPASKRSKPTTDPLANAAPRVATPFASKEELRAALEEKLAPPCPLFLSAQAVETEMPSDLAFALFAFLACEHPTLVPSTTLAATGVETCCCPWSESQLALRDARAVWATIRAQWTELETPFAVREVAAAAPDLTSPPQLLVRGNIALQNAVNMVQYACSKRSVAMKVWGCLQRTIQQDALRVLVQRGRQAPPWEMMDRRLWRERYMLTTLHVPKLVAALPRDDCDDAPAQREVGAELEAELAQIELILDEFYDELRRVYRYYASIDAELQRTDHLLRHQKGGAAAAAAAVSRDAQDEERFFRKISLSMSLVEFHVFLKDCRVFGTARPFPYEFIERVFEQVNLEVAATAQTAHTPPDDAIYDHNGSEMTPAEFVEALVHIARSKYVRLRHATQAAAMPLAHRFRRMLVDVVLANAMQEKERVNVFHEQLLTPACREVLAKHQKGLHGVYARFADAGNAETAFAARKRQSRMLSVNGLVVLLKFYGMLREHFLNLDEVQHLLSGVLQLERDGIQFDLGVVAACLARLHEQEHAVADARDAHARKASEAATLSHPWMPRDDELFITYAEFLEVLAAVACYLRPDAFVLLAEKLDDFFTNELRLRAHNSIRDKT